LFSTDFAIRHMPIAWRGFGHGLSVVCQMDGRFLHVVIRREGKSLPHASLTLTGVPVFERHGDGDHLLGAG